MERLSNLSKMQKQWRYDLKMTILGKLIDKQLQNLNFKVNI